MEDMMNSQTDTPTSPKVSFTQVLRSWVDGYSKNKELGIENFLVSQFEKSIKGIDSSESKEMLQIISSEINTYEQRKEEIERAVDAGGSKEEWMSDFLLMNTEEYGQKDQTNILGTLHNGLADAVGISYNKQPETEKTAPLQGVTLAKSISDLTTGRVMQVLGEDTESDEENDYTGNSEFVENALKSNSDIELKTLASGAMVVLQHIGKLPMIPQTVPTQVITNIACIAVDHAKTIAQIARKEISLTKGLSQIARNSFSAICGILQGKHKKLTSEGIMESVPILKNSMPIINKISSGITNLIGDEVFQENLALVKNQVISVTKNFAQGFIKAAIPMVRNVAHGIKNFFLGQKI